jgi:dephospho-CoA kinase
MKIVGVTGGIGSGKTQFCNYLAELGAFVFNADRVAKELMVADENVISAIKQAFGSEAYLNDGQLNKPYLAHQAFALKRSGELNAIVHPAVYKETERQAKQAEKQGFALFIKEAALLLQNGRPALYDYIVWVEASVDIRLKRTKKRDNVTEETVLDRMGRQANLEDVRHWVDEVIINNGSEEELSLLANDFWQRLVTH